MPGQRTFGPAAYLVCAVAPICLVLEWLIVNIQQTNSIVAAYMEREVSRYPRYPVFMGRPLSFSDAIPAAILGVALVVLGLIVTHLIWKSDTGSAAMLVIGSVVLAAVFWIGFYALFTPVLQCFNTELCPVDLRAPQANLGRSSWLIAFSIVSQVLTIALLNLDDPSPPPTNSRIKQYL